MTLLFAFAMLQEQAAQGGFEAEIRAVSPPEGRTVLLVAPEGAPDPEPGAPSGLAGIAKRYGRTLLFSGNVISIAPSTMKLILAPPKEPNPFLDLAPRDAFKLLAARLGPKQWAALTSEQGLGLEDLAASDDRFLFGALVMPGGQLLARSTLAAPGEHREKPIDLSATAAQARLRLGTEVRPMISDGAGGFMGTLGTRRYDVSLGEGSGEGKIMGAEAARILPNRLKESQLDYALAALRREIDLTGVRTVGEAISRVRKASGLELYADARFAAHSMVVIGQSKASGSDLLRGLALGVAGTYRRIGPAYVLTDSITGVGALRERWSRFIEAGYARLREEQKLADARLLAEFDPARVAGLPGTLGYSPEQQKKAGRRSGGEVSGLETTYKSLTPAQQKAVQEEVQAWREQGETVVLGGEAKVYLSQNYRLELLHPDLGAPANYPSVPNFLTRRPVAPTRPVPFKESIREEFGRFTQRAAMLSPVAAGEASLMDTLAQAKVEHIWLDVEERDLPALKPTVDLFRAKGFAIGLCLDIFPPAPMGTDSDRNIAGEASDHPRPDSPTAIAQHTKILTEILSLKVDAVVVKRPFPPGYSRTQFVMPDDMRPSLGYTPEARLSFLRLRSVDPIDTFLYRNQEMAKALTLESFDDEDLEGELDSAWNDARYARLEEALRAFVARISPKVRCLVTATRAPIGNAWFADWNGTGAAPGGAFKDGREAVTPKKAVQDWQRASGRPVLFPVTFGKGTTADILAHTFAYYADLGAQGVVLDLRGMKAGDAAVLKLLRALRP